MENEGTVRLARMFCPANDRNVPILFRHRQTEIDSLSRSSPGEPISCLDYGVRCTGWLCPHFAAPSLPEGRLLQLALSHERTHPKRGSTGRQEILERALSSPH